MAKKVIIIGLAIVMCLGICLGVFTGCEDDFTNKRINVWIKEEYREKFIAEDFTIEDFEWDNIKKIQHYEWFDGESPQRGWLVVTLKKASKKRAKDAAEHFETLEFVSSANPWGKPSKGVY